MGVFKQEEANIDQIGLLMGGKKDTLDSTEVVGSANK
jgi:hypothetical protein